MNNLNMRPFWYILAAYSALVFFLASLAQGLDLRNILDLLRLVPVVATADGIAYFIFATWIWRWRPLHGWLVPYPDLNGTWQGVIQSTWKDAEGRPIPPIPAILAIKQSFSRVSCVMRTAEMVSHSYLEGFDVDPASQVRRLCYSYTSRPSAALRERSTPHDGTILLNIIGTPASRLEGEYWTQRQTSGTANFRFLTKRLLDELPGDLPPHPMSHPLDPP
jgi:hypothetical protein